jgi:AraC-like DNA-binding protein/ligand-binding sensor protein
VKNAPTALSGALRQEFRKDLELFKHFLLLLNDAGPIRNVELMWNEDLDPTKPKFKNRVGTGDALIQLQPAGNCAANRNSPSTLFCDLVHGFGAHEEETCARSDVPAQQRCRETGCSEVYACHVGLTDIAVPVICDGEYLGTLFSGQVLTHTPTAEGFAFVRTSLAGQPHINFESLETAYYRVPVVDPAQLAEMVRVLELFARYIANSWKRLKIMAEFQTTQNRQVALDRKELAAIFLSGEVGDPQELKALARRAGLQRLPNRVLVMQIDHSGAERDLRPEIAGQMTLNRLSHVVEDFCSGQANTLTMVVRPGELCIFTIQDVPNPHDERLSLQETAKAILATIPSHSGAMARIGISTTHSQPAELVRAYQEASAALDLREGKVSFFDDPAPLESQPVKAMERLLKAIRQGTHVPLAIREFLAHAMSSGHSVTTVQQSRALLTWAVEHLTLEVVGIVAHRGDVTTAKEQAITGILHASSVFSAGEAFHRFAESLARQVASAFASREHKIARAIYQLIEERGAARLRIKDAAEALHLSPGHLSRIFRRATGVTLETFLIEQRVELARQALLDPRLNVAEVAERCGFCSPAYFASVFKKHVNCTPREFARRPHLHPVPARPRSCLPLLLYSRPVWPPPEMTSKTGLRK